MNDDERKIYMKLLKNGIHYDIERLREFIKMVDDTCEQVKEIEKKKQRERARKVLSVLN
jgi:hypothetical protein